jgi:hypothetical protein
MVKKGDRVALESEKVGRSEKTGEVVGVRGPLIQVRWDDGRETSVIPSAGSLRVLPPRVQHERAP